MLADEIRDISNREELVLCLRYVTEKYKIYEDVIGLYQLDNTTASTVHSALKDSFFCSWVYLLPIAVVRLMVELRTFRDTLVELLSTFVAALPVYCLAHCINLSLQEAAQIVKSVREGLNLAMDVIKLKNYHQSDKFC